MNEVSRPQAAAGTSRGCAPPQPGTQVAAGRRCVRGQSSSEWGACASDSPLRQGLRCTDGPGAGDGGRDAPGDPIKTQSGPDATAGDGATTPPGKGSDAGADAWTAPDVGAPVEAGSPGQVDLTFVITASQNVQPISPYIYGVNDGSKLRQCTARSCARAATG